MNLGAGRIVHQDFTRISQDVSRDAFSENSVLANLCNALAASGGTLHVFGLVSPGGVHSHEDHIVAAIEMAYTLGVQRVCLHAFLDGRDVPPRSAKASLTKLDNCFGGRPGGITTVTGRYYAMDRDQRWERVEVAWRVITDGVGSHSAETASEALQAAYDRGENDEFVAPTVICPVNTPPRRVEDGDAVLFMNFRADRARQLTTAFVDEHFEGFARSRFPDLAQFVMLTEYSAELARHAACAYPPVSLQHSLGETIAAHHLTQTRIAETEKYAHVTFFFSCGREAEFAGETRRLVPSPHVATYDLAPEMSAVEVTDELVGAIASGTQNLIVCNYANGDMVGHTGVLPAAIKAVECIDACLARVIDALGQVGGQCLITADHGNVEQMDDPISGQPHTAHTCEPVPLVYVGPARLELSEGRLCDVAPTILTLMGLSVPVEMTGVSLAHMRKAAAS